jgi:hypothetical protein
MRTRTIWSTALAVSTLGLLAAGSASAERSLLGITVGRSYRTVLAKYGDPTRIDPVFLPTGTAPQLGQQYAGVGGFGGQPGFPGQPGDNSGGFPGAPGGFSGGAPGGFPGGGGPGGAPGGLSGGGGAFPGAPGGGGPPILPGAGGFPGAPGGEAGGAPGGFPGAPGGGPGGFPAGGGFSGGGGQGGSTTGNAAVWTYNKQGGVTLEFLINEDGLVAQISVSGSGKGFNTSTSKGIQLGSGYTKLLNTYGFPDRHLIMSVGQTGVQQAAMPYSAVVKSGGQATQLTYTSKHNVSFILLNQKVVRMTVALAE